MDELNNGDEPTTMPPSPTSSRHHHPVPGRTRQSALSKVQSLSRSVWHYYIVFSTLGTVALTVYQGHKLDIARQFDIPHVHNTHRHLVIRWRRG